MKSLTLSLLDGVYAICRLGPDDEIPAWAGAGGFRSVTRTPAELSIVCEEPRVPDAVRREGGWRALKLEGPFAFSETGVIASIAGPLAAAGVSVFVISTFDTDYLLVKSSQLEPARRALRDGGHHVRFP